ncbi:amino acid ABC transporter permease [Mesorhizobium sp. AaZ16]|uniref:amino acid ABC transporter permease n=1 Tax=Mesorhizobium sp. AaZ16 TaxID=3402289 RepID=UPI00374F6900
MHYIFDYSWMASYIGVLISGLKLTVTLIWVGGSLGFIVSVLCAWIRTLGGPWTRFVVGSYVEFIRNTPFIIQLFFIFFGLPQMGLQLHEATAAYIAMTINLGAYGCEIIRAGIQVTPKGQWEAGASLGMSKNQAFLYIVLLPALNRTWPAFSSQIVIVMLGSAVVSQISVEDLTFAASFIQSRTFRAFEVYLATTIVYLGLAVAIRYFLSLLGRFLFYKGTAQ